MQATSLMVAFVAAVAAPASVLAEVVQHRKSTLRATVGVDQFQRDLRGALGDVLGCGAEDGPQADLDAIEKRLLPVWNSLPKSAGGRIERPLLRYMVHRYFMGTSALVVRGFEPSQPVNTSLVGSVVDVPAYVEAVLESQHAQVHGFDLKDAVHVVAMLKKFITDADSMVLEQSYVFYGKKTTEALDQSGLMRVLRDYMAFWLMQDDPAALERFRNGLRTDPSNMYNEFPHWDRVIAFVNGVVKSFTFQRFRTAKGLTRTYTFGDVKEMISTMTSTFGFYWDDLCIEMKDQLVSMDTSHTGRVPLSVFYSKPLSLEWRFAESEGYLRELGALDETSRWHGKEVIIPNYIQAASNCALATQHYLLCCTLPCDDIFSELEVAIGGPVAPPEQILEIVGNMSYGHTAGAGQELDDEDAPRLRGSLQRQLEQIAASHGGLIPVHGRLFAQWLHYVFPRECPFPHKSGSTSQVRPRNFASLASDHYIVREEDRVRLVESSDLKDREGGFPDLKVDKEAMQWMSQWSSEEELISDYTMVLRPPSGVDYLAVVGVVILAAMLAAGAAGFGGQSGSLSSSTPTARKSHFV